MTGKLTKSEKIMQIIAVIILVSAIVVRAAIGVSDIGIMIILAFTGILTWLIFFVCAFFPSDWRLTEEQKASIKDRIQYQNTYRKCMIIADVAIAVFFALIIFFVV